MVSTCWGHWKMNEANGNALDALGVRDLTETGTVPAQGGKINGARGLFSSSNYFTVSHGTTFSDAQDISVCAWVQCKNDASDDQTWIVTDETANEFVFWFSYYSNLFTLQVGKSGVAAYNATKSVALVSDAWYWVCGTYNAATKKANIYVNNVVGTEASYAVSGATASDNFYFGNGYGRPCDNFYIDDARIYSNVLTSTEMAFIYNSGSGTENELAAAPKFRRFGKFWWKK